MLPLPSLSDLGWRQLWSSAGCSFKVNCPVTAQESDPGQVTGAGSDLLWAILCLWPECPSYLAPSWLRRAWTGAPGLTASGCVGSDGGGSSGRVVPVARIASSPISGACSIPPPSRTLVCLLVLSHHATAQSESSSSSHRVAVVLDAAWPLVLQRAGTIAKLNTILTVQGFCFPPCFLRICLKNLSFPQPNICSSHIISALPDLHDVAFMMHNPILLSLLAPCLHPISFFR